MRRLTRTLTVVILLVACAPTTAGARTVEVQRGDGAVIAISWPLSPRGQTLRVGEVLGIGVVQQRRGARTVVVEVRRNGRQITARRTRTRFLKLRVRWPPGRYRVSASIGRRTIVSAPLTVSPANPTPAVSGESQPSQLPAPASRCDASAPIAGRLDMVQSTAIAGQVLDFRSDNTSRACLAPIFPRLEQGNGDGTWTSVDAPQPPAPAIYSPVLPGESSPGQFTVPASAPPGTYWLIATGLRAPDAAHPEAAPVEAITLAATFSIA